MLRTFDRKLKSLLQTKGRIDLYLEDLISNYKQKPFNKPLLTMLKKSTNVFAALKIMVILHNLIYKGLIDSQICDGYLKKIIFKMQGLAQRYMVEKLFNPYKLYLQKRNGLSFKIDKKDSYQTQKQLFVLINQIKLIQTFLQIIYIFGRYYPDYEFAIDFSIILAKDVNKLYKQITLLLYRNRRQFIMLQIQLLHQVMYPIFFNKYYHQYVYSYCPIWIQTDVVSSTPTTKKHKLLVSRDYKTNQTQQNSRQNLQKVSYFNTEQDSQLLKKTNNLKQQNPIDKLLPSQFIRFDIADIDEYLYFQQAQQSTAA